MPNWPGLLANLARKGTPDRVYHMELFHDPEVQDALCERFDIRPSLPRTCRAGPRRRCRVPRATGQVSRHG